MRRNVQCLVLGVALLGPAASAHAQAPVLSAARSTSVLSDAAPAAVAPATPADAAAPDAADPVPMREWFGSDFRWTNWSRMTGDWDHLRTQLERAGLTVSVDNTTDVSRLALGAVRRRVSGRGLTTVGLGLDLERLVGLDDAEAFVQYKSWRGVSGAAYAGDAQGFSNIDAEPFGRFYEVWFQRRFRGPVRVKVGRIDANTEFAAVENASEFLNSSMGYSPTIWALPTYPNPHLGVVVQYEPESGLYGGGGVFNGGPAVGVGDLQALFTIGQVGVRWARWGGGRLGVGHWQTSVRASAASLPGAVAGTSGQFLVLDQTLWAADDGADPRSVSAFLQLGKADPRVSALGRHIGAGVVASGLVPGRPRDAVGFGVTTAKLGQYADPVVAQGQELAVDGFYRIQITGWLAVKPDLQAIVSPGGDRARRPVVAGTIRLDIGF
jgi:porin